MVRAFFYVSIDLINELSVNYPIHCVGMDVLCENNILFIISRFYLNIYIDTL